MASRRYFQNKFCKVNKTAKQDMQFAHYVAAWSVA
jgi:hypothetical protein